MTKEVYHTQEKREKKITKPVLCTRQDAWFGNGYYFWHYLEDARMWGKKSKQKTGAYEIYMSEIDCSNVLDTVFNEETYNWWVEQIEKITKEITKKHSSNKKPTIKQLNDWIKKTLNGLVLSLVFCIKICRKVKSIV